MTTYLTSGQSRREVRGAVLAQLSVVEAARWDGPDAVPYHQFRTECRALETAAMIARVPRDAVEHYLHCARAARSLSQDNWEKYGEDEVGGFISAEIDALVNEAAQILTELIWTPRRRRIGLRYRLAKAKYAVEHRLDEGDREIFEQAEQRKLR